jgi:hypothetical protein
VRSLKKAKDRPLTVSEALAELAESRGRRRDSVFAQISVSACLTRAVLWGRRDAGVTKPTKQRISRGDLERPAGWINRRFPTPFLSHQANSNSVITLGVSTR